MDSIELFGGMVDANADDADAIMDELAELPTGDDGASESFYDEPRETSGEPEESDGVLVDDVSEAYPPTLTVTRDEPGDVAITDADREAFAEDVQTGFMPIYRRAENAIINMGRWLRDMQDKYADKFVPLISEALPGLKPSTRENYIALSAWNDADPQSYDEWRKREPSLGIRYELAKAALRGDDLGVRYLAVAGRRKGLLGEGNGGDALDLANRAPGLNALYEAGHLHADEAERILARLDNTDDPVSPAVDAIVRRYGVREAECVRTLHNIDKSIRDARREGSTLADVLAGIAASSGFVVLPDGEQVAVYECSNRELWAAYREGVKEHQQVDDSITAPKIINDEISYAQALALAEAVGDDDAASILNTNYVENSWFKLVLKPVED